MDGAHAVEDMADVEERGYREGSKGSVCSAIVASTAIGVAPCRLRRHPPPHPGRQAGSIEETRQDGRAAAPNSDTTGTTPPIATKHNAMGNRNPRAFVRTL